MNQMKHLSLLTDFYQLTMMNGYLKNDMMEEEVVFDLFFRENPCHSGYTIVAGIEQIIDYIENLKFYEDELAYLSSLGTFGEDFIDALRNFTFKGTIHGVEEGTIMFPHEPILRVKGTCFETQIIETALLNVMNHQSLIATKAARIVTAAKGDPVFEFGLRRAQGPDAGVYGARAAVIGGCVSTSNVLAGMKFNLSVMGTQAHSWIQKFPSELEAFRAYAKAYPDECLLLVDTYNTLEAGVPNAIQVFKELRARGHEPKGIRIDSGDIAYLSKQARNMLDAAGFPKATIVASSDLDEDTITALKDQQAQIDGWGVGTNLITSKDCPALGGVYKLSAAEQKGELIPKIKISNNPEKITNPGFKNIYRIYDRKTQTAQADLITLEHEVLDESQPLTIFHPIYTWKQTTFSDYRLKKLLTPIFVEGKLVYRRRSTQEIKEKVSKELASLWPEYKRLTRPQIYKVDLSEALWQLKQNLVNENKIPPQK